MSPHALSPRVDAHRIGPSCRHQAAGETQGELCGFVLSVSPPSPRSRGGTLVARSHGSQSRLAPSAAVCHAGVPSSTSGRSDGRPPRGPCICGQKRGAVGRAPRKRAVLLPSGRGVHAGARRALRRQRAEEGRLLPARLPRSLPPKFRQLGSHETQQLYVHFPILI